MAVPLFSSSEVLRCNDKQRICEELARIWAAVKEDEEAVVKLGLEGLHTTLLRLLMSEDEDVSEAAAQAIDACVKNCPHGVLFPMSARQLCESSANPFIRIDLEEAAPYAGAHVSSPMQGVALDEAQSSEGPSKASPSINGSQGSDESFLCNSATRTSKALPSIDTNVGSCQQTSSNICQLLDARSAPESREESSSTAQGQDGTPCAACSSSLPEGLPFYLSQSSDPNSSLKSEACFPLQIKLRKIRERQDRKIGNMLWLSAIALSRWIIRNQRTAIAGKNVLEIGSGLGLCGIVAGRYARSVVLTDFDPVIVRNLEYNLQCNRQLLRERGRTCCAKRLDWYDLPVGPSASNEDEETNQSPVGRSRSNESSKSGPTKAASSLCEKIHPHDGAPSLENVTRGGNGSGNEIESAKSPEESSFNGERSSGCPGGEEFDVIIGSDVVHEKPMADGVVAVLKRFLAWNGVAIIVNPHSHHRAGVERFCKLLDKNGFQSEVALVEKEDLDGRPKSTIRREQDFQRSPQEHEGHSGLQESDVMARFQDEVKDVTLELYLISKIKQRPS